MPSCVKSPCRPAIEQSPLEPFGIAPLEAMLYDVPVIIARQSGVSEVLHHALTVDYWDVDELANKICAALTYDALTREMIERSREELKAITWDRAARQIEEVYRKVTGSSEPIEPTEQTNQ